MSEHLLENGDTFRVSLNGWGEVTAGDYQLSVYSDMVHIVTGEAMRRMLRKLSIPQVAELSIFTFLKWKLQLAFRGYVSAKDVHAWND